MFAEHHDYSTSRCHARPGVCCSSAEGARTRGRPEQPANCPAIAERSAHDCFRLGAPSAGNSWSQAGAHLDAARAHCRCGHVPTYATALCRKYGVACGRRHCDRHDAEEPRPSVHHRRRRRGWRVGADTNARAQQLAARWRLRGVEGCRRQRCDSVEALDGWRRRGRVHQRHLALLKAARAFPPHFDPNSMGISPL